MRGGDRSPLSACRKECRGAKAREENVGKRVMGETGGGDKRSAGPPAGIDIHKKTLLKKRKRPSGKLEVSGRSEKVDTNELFCGGPTILIIHKRTFKEPGG